MTGASPQPGPPGPSTPPPAPIRCSWVWVTSPPAPPRMTPRPATSSRVSRERLHHRRQRLRLRDGDRIRQLLCPDAVGRPIGLRSHPPVPGNHDWGTGGPRGPGPVLRLLRRQRNAGRQQLLQLRHPEQQLAHRQSGLRVPAGARRLRCRFSPGAMAQGGPGSEQQQERDRAVAQATLQLGHHQLPGAAATVG